jgi:diaminohydroxyphosphoribosylaminopyrimidine deaminase/5-amino-6-(5-phosphoribosylamino)uracil reductase
MNRALELAARGLGLVSPNPAVGAVLVNRGQVVGEGFHLYQTVKHAEATALEVAAERARGATLYCTLEPCCHQGRTPPCSEALIEAGIARAVIAVRDPNPLVDGRGIEQLRSAGIVVELGVCEREARLLNETYFKYIVTGVPFVHAVTGIGLSSWRPSRAILEAVSVYDAVIIGDTSAVDRNLLEACLSRARHRPLVVAASRDAFERLDIESKRNEGRVTTIALEAAASHLIDEEKLSLLTRLGETGVTSVLLLPAQATSDIAVEIDKLTVVGEGEGASSGAFLRDAKTTAEGRHTEVTGYPNTKHQDLP